MKTKLILRHLLVTACVALPVAAADQKKGAEDLVNPPSPPYSERTDRSFRLERLGRVERASDLLGREVKNDQNEKLGKVDELAVDLESGRIAQVILATGGFVGIGDRTVAVPPRAFRCDAEAKVLRLDADKEKLKAAPVFEMSKWPDGCESRRVAATYRYFGYEPFFVTTELGSNLEQERSASPPRSSDVVVHARETTGRAASLGYVVRASKVIGMTVKNLQNEKLGKVENLAVDLEGGRVVAAILSSGGFLGIADELSAVPPGALHYNAEHDGLVLDATKASVTQAPHFKGAEWPDLGQPVYTVEIYRAYRVEPYFSSIPDADNTARNIRDRHEQNLTPLDQGNSAADIQTSARIRKEILAEKGLSVSARNVKIITANGQVTLRGPVDSEGEKQLLGEIAGRIAGAEKVDNQLEVKQASNK